MSQIFPLTSKRGQFILIEHMLLFAIGVIIFTSSFYTFTKAKDKIDTYSTEEIFKTIANYVVNNIVKTYELGKGMNSSNKSEVKVELRLPQKINGQYYRLNILENEVEIFSLTTSSIKYTRSIHNLNESVNINGSIDTRGSNKFTLKYNKTGNKIILR